MLKTVKLSLLRLLDRSLLQSWLATCRPLLAEMQVALVENDGRILMEVGVPPEAGLETPSSSFPLKVQEQVIGTLQATGWGVTHSPGKFLLPVIQQGLELLLLCGMDSRALAQETLERYREINLLYKIGETIGSSLDPEIIPELILEEAKRVIQSDVGCVVLKDKLGKFWVAADFGLEVMLRALEEAGQILCADGEMLESATILTPGQFSDSEKQLATILSAPLRTRENKLGVVLLGRKKARAVFSAGELKLLTAATSQVAVMMENARLFVDIKQQRDAIAEMKNYMDNIFASIASGVITTDMADRISLLNRAAEEVLCLNAAQVVGNSYLADLPGVGPSLAVLAETVKQSNHAVIGRELQSTLPERGQVNLQLHLSPLLNNYAQSVEGVAIVLEDLTAQRQLEAEVQQVRGTFERYVSPSVVQQLLSDPSRVRLGGVRQDVSIFFADLGGFTTFSENLDPEVLFVVLNRYLTLGAQAVLDEGGTLDKFMGDAVMAIFNAPLPQSDYAFRAVRAAWNLKCAIQTLHARPGSAKEMLFGVGIGTGPAVVGNVGSPQLQNYTAIGGSVNLASRLQEYAEPGQILIEEQTYQLVSQNVRVRQLGEIHFKGYSKLKMVYEVVGWQGN
ncbi:MAG: adenylate/guanylate cyclase domain-containing protein [Chloroflexota bacterium]|nr:adenylate/guanylate cyclase domain-containing protein [Chloroflexota bacterium]